MKLRLRIGRQRAQTVGTDEAPVRDAAPAPTSTSVSTSARVPLPRTEDRSVVRAGAFCRADEVGRTAVTESGRAVLAVPAGRCGRWVYDDDLRHAAATLATGAEPADDLSAGRAPAPAPPIPESRSACPA